ncbi:MAG: hypothetical protein ACO331_04885 [Prochlorothrix sp.]
MESRSYAGAEGAIEPIGGERCLAKWAMVLSQIGMLSGGEAEPE